MRASRGFTGACATLMIASAAVTRGAVEYTVRDLGSLGGWTSYGNALNNIGQVAGLSDTIQGQNIQHAYFWNGASMQDLGVIAGRYSAAWDVNDHGHVVGFSEFGSGTTFHAVHWSNGQRRDLSVQLFGGAPGLAYGINNSSQVTGAYSTGGSAEHAFLTNGGPGGGTAFTDLGTLPGYSSSIGLDVNSNGVVVGSSFVPFETGQRAFIYRPGVGMQDLGVAGSANGVNEAGTTVVGSVGQDIVGFRAFVWRNGQVTHIGTLPGGTQSAANGVNAADVVVGTSDASGGDNRAFLYRNGQLINLNTLIDPAAGWTLFQARDINDAGQIVGSGIFNGAYHAYLLTPIPESVGALLGAPAALAALRRRRAPRRNPS
jgi:probable HAF family extracellular repeat protein